MVPVLVRHEHRVRRGQLAYRRRVAAEVRDARTEHRIGEQHGIRVAGE